MKIFERFENRVIGEVKEKAEQINWTPIVTTVFAGLLLIRLTQKPNTTIVNVYTDKS
jgi:hypothetical protein